ncbi:1,4-alpha-glucan branching enzyme [Methylophilus rhizosphaerae]|uniref:1,4-alpha-glucan branching enzyme GlgB n=1 Tax=Methylophilus rhizosphaerae TaxID=492660 RepID=A0A1G9AYQ2_9PROT|nr:1,4-alpha-glucan branching protein GlgB [Methylophilus rhizosphaerae]SDK32469.1 1,4-alpha-glucan branching enzyme [Methylophilus rhizosphaerae]
MTAKLPITHHIDTLHLQRILDATHHDPFQFLGTHQPDAGCWKIRIFQPHAEKVWINLEGAWQPMELAHRQGLFVYTSSAPLPRPASLRIQPQGQASLYETVDPYGFDSTLSDEALYLFAEGKLLEAYNTLGAIPMTILGVAGVRFAVWAPNAERVSVVGNFNQWDGRIHAMRALGDSGVWELFIPHLTTHDLYKFEIRNREHGQVMLKADPYGKAFEARPGTANRICESHYHWQDAQWLQQRQQYDWLHAPFNCYEVHLGSWQRDEQGHFLSYRSLADTLIPHLTDMGYTHIELLPIAEHPLNESWGYQVTGYFAPTQRYGSPDDLKYFIDRCHAANIGVILDWVPGHFPKDDWALARFDGTALYEHADPRLGEHMDWGTYIFNYGRNEVRSFLLSNAYYWLQEFHIDGLRVDAVASMLYLDYSRNEGEWLPNQYGGRENLDVVEFLKQLNIMIGERFAGALVIAEESTAWPAVSRPVYAGGLGFSMKWNMGWMNDILTYMQLDPLYRQYHHNRLTFGQMYAYSENFVLPFSHDEVVHGKKSLLEKMPGDSWQKFANLRLLLTMQMTMPGKKLNFMGNEFAQEREWNVNQSLDWHLLEESNPEHKMHRGVQALVRQLNTLYRQSPALHASDFDVHGFQWIDCQDAAQSTLSYIRRGNGHSFVIIVLNFTPVPRQQYRLGVPQSGYYREIFNSDAACYGGSDFGNGSGCQTDAMPWMEHPVSISINLPPLAGVILQLQ